MKNLIKFTIACLVSFCATDSFAQTKTAKTYQSIVEAIYSAKGAAIVDFEAGTWETHYNNSILRWTFNTHTTADVNYNFAEGSLISANIEFDPGVRVFMSKGSQCV